MRAGTRTVGPGATVAEAMVAGGMGVLQPRGPGAAEARRLKRLRHCARRLVHAYGDVVVADIDERWLRRHRADAGEAMGVGREVAGRAFTVLRQVVSCVQATGGRPRVMRRLPPRRRRAMDEAPDRLVAPWETVAALVARGPLWVRAAVALQAHLGACPGVVLSLRVQDVELEANRVVVRVPGRRGRVRVIYALPRDALAAIRPWWDRRSTQGPTARLFPQRGNQRRPRTCINRVLVREARRLRVPRTTMAQLRRLAQAGLRGVGAVRAQVRGSALRPSRGRTLTRSELSRQRWAWAWQQGAEEQGVPVRAPKGCHADEPECRPRQVPRRPRRERNPPTPLRRAVPWGPEASSP